MSIFGLCAVLQCLLQSPVRLPALVELAPSFIPIIVAQLEALVEAYKGEGEERGGGGGGKGWTGRGRGGGTCEGRGRGSDMKGECREGGEEEGYCA